MRVLVIDVSGDDISTAISIGTTVTWRTGSGTGEGRVVAVHPRPVVRRVNGVRLARLGTPDDPAYEIEAADGGLLLRLGSEIEPVR